MSDTALLLVIRCGMTSTPVPCSCGCGTIVEVTPYRMSLNRTGHFFVNMVHLHRWMWGPNHPNYRGGEKMRYGPDWPRIAVSIRLRDKVCQLCGKTPAANKRALDVHHIVPWRVSHDNRPGNLIALCRVCHKRQDLADQCGDPGPLEELLLHSRVCLVCGKHFKTRNSLRQLCSKPCQRERQRQKIREHGRRRTDRKPGGRSYEQHRAYIKRWQQDNKDRVNAGHRAGKARRAATRGQGLP